MNFKVFLLLIFFACLLHTPDVFAGDGNTKNTSELSVDQYKRPKKRKYTKVGGSRKYRGPSITNRNKHYARRKQYRRTGGMGNNMLSGGITSGLNYGSFAGIKGSYDYKFHPYFSAGLQGNIYFLEQSLTYNGAYGLSLRANFHFSDLINVSAFDLYGGVSLGTTLAREGWVKKSPITELSWNIHIGARYNLNNQWVVFSEIGKQTAAVGVGISF